MGRFDGKVAIVTGGGNGMGRHIALMLAAEGAKVVVNDINTWGPEDAQNVAKEINDAGGIAVANVGDIGTMEGGKAAVQAAIDNFGKIDLLALIAGTVIKKSVDEMTEGEYDRVCNTNAKGIFSVVHYAAPYLKEQGYGRICIFASRAAFGNGKSCAYSAGKAGAMGLGAELGYELTPFGIKTNTILPAAVTNLFPASKAAYDATPKPWPEGPDMTAPFACWLLSEECCCSGEFFFCAGTDVCLYPRSRTPIGIIRKGNYEKWTLDELDHMIPETFGWYFDTKASKSAR